MVLEITPHGNRRKNTVAPIEITLDYLKSSVDELIKNVPAEWWDLYFKYGSYPRSFPINVPTTVDIGEDYVSPPYTLYCQILDEVLKKIKEYDPSYGKHVIRKRLEELRNKGKIKYKYDRLCNHDQASANDCIEKYANIDAPNDRSINISGYTASGEHITYHIYRREKGELFIGCYCSNYGFEEILSLKKGEKFFDKMAKLSGKGIKKIENITAINETDDRSPGRKVLHDRERCASDPLTLLFSVFHYRDYEIKVVNKPKNMTRNDVIRAGADNYKRCLEELLLRTPSEWLTAYIAGKSLPPEEVPSFIRIDSDPKMYFGVSNMHFKVYKDMLDKFIELIKVSNKDFGKEKLPKLRDKLTKGKRILYKPYSKYKYGQEGLNGYILDRLRSEPTGKLPIITVFTGTSKDGLPIKYYIKKEDNGTVQVSYCEDESRKFRKADFIRQYFKIEDFNLNGNGIDIFKNIGAFEKLGSVKHVENSRLPTKCYDSPNPTMRELWWLYFGCKDRGFEVIDRPSIREASRLCFGSMERSYYIDKERPIQINTEPLVSTSDKVSTPDKVAGMKKFIPSILTPDRVSKVKELLTSDDTGMVVYDEEILRTAIEMDDEYRPYIGLKIANGGNCIIIEKFMEGTPAEEWAHTNNIEPGCLIALKAGRDYSGLMKKIRSCSLTIDDIDVENSTLNFEDGVVGDKHEVLQKFCNIKPQYYDRGGNIVDPVIVRNKLLGDMEEIERIRAEERLRSLRSSAGDMSSSVIRRTSDERLVRMVNRAPPTVG